MMGLNYQMVLILCQLFKIISNISLKNKKNKPLGTELMDPPDKKNDSDKTQDICMPYVGNGYV